MIFSILLSIALYVGRVVDEQHRPLPYATVYSELDPQQGTATDRDGLFSFYSSSLPSESNIIVSYVGFEKQVLPLTALMGQDTLVIVLSEQPIALEEAVIAAPEGKKPNRRKALEMLISRVYDKMQRDFDTPITRYKIVSDVRMDSEKEPWGVEQMIASAIVIPDTTEGGSDSLQFKGEYCKRYFNPLIRSRADTILSSDLPERVGKGKGDLRQAANAVDSGLLVHKGLFYIGDAVRAFEKHKDTRKGWAVSNESEEELVLTYTEKMNFLGIFVYSIRQHFIVDSYSYALLRYSVQADVKLSIPFGYKLKGDELALLNLLNMDEEEIVKFRLRKVNMAVQFNQLYRERDAKRYQSEKNLVMSALITGAKKAEIPIAVSATQRVTGMEINGVQPFKASELSPRVARQLVPIE